MNAMSEEFETIRYTADVVAVTEDGRVLLIERGWPPHQGQFALPGGHVDPGETAGAAAARELEEETGVQVASGDLVLVGLFDAPGRDPRGRYVSAAYMVTVPAGTVARAGDDAAAVRWAPLAEPGESLAFDHGEILHAAWRQRLAAGYARQVAAETGTDRCGTAHPTDPSDCKGPVAVTVVDRSGAGADGCEHHAARMLASLKDARVYALPDAPEGAAVRTFIAASALPPYAWLQPIRR